MISLKSLKISLTALALVIVAGACDDGFEELNTNPNASPVITPDLLFSYTQNGISAHRFEMWRSNLLHASVYSNHMITPWTPPYITNDGWITAFWDRMYEREVVNIKEAIKQIAIEASSSEVGKDAIARIWKVFIFQRITDFWGDIPYSQAGLGFEEGIVEPVYDSQQAIYQDMLAELTSAVAALTPGGNSFGAADIMYGGDHDSWIRFGNSLRLRLGMRLSNADAGVAQSNVEAAAAGQLISSNAQIARTPHPDNSPANQFSAGTNGSSAPIVAGFNGNYLSADLVNILQGLNDPRLNIYGTLPTNGTHRGFPNGNPATPPTPALSVADYTLPNSNPGSVFAIDADAVMQSYAEVSFLLAEAAVRGWNVGGASPMDLYTQGITASLEYHGVDAAAVATYVAAAAATYGAATTDAERYELIATQKWLALFGDGWESWAEVRRTGYPTFTQANGNIPRRVRYPVSEQTLNSSNYSSAVGALSGGDLETSNFYWAR